MNKLPWQCLEAIPGLSAVPAVWRRHLGESFGPFRAAFLQTKATSVRSFPCPRECGCAHLIISEGQDQSPTIALCRCEPPTCHPLSLSLADIIPLQLNWTRLGRALCKTFGLDLKPTDFPIPNTRQLGSWSVDAVPVVLTLQTDRHVFRRVLAELALRLRTPFILFTPTGDHLDAAGHELLAHARAAFFALASHALLSSQGTLHPAKTPGELFAQFTPQPKDSLAEDTTRKAFALVKALDSRRRIKRPSPGTVFSFYCIDGLSVTDIARKCHCSRGTILNRLEFIRQKTGADPVRVRQLSAQFESIQDQTSDPRARRTSAKRLIYDSPDPGDEEQ